MNDLNDLNDLNGAFIRREYILCRCGEPKGVRPGNLVCYDEDGSIVRVKPVEEGVVAEDEDEDIDYAEQE